MKLKKFNYFIININIYMYISFKIIHQIDNWYICEILKSWFLEIKNYKSCYVKMLGFEIYLLSYFCIRWSETDRIMEMW